MKERKVVILVFLSIILFLSTDIFADLYYRMLFERGLYCMEGSLDPQGTINLFREIMNRHPYDRYYAARSLLYIGICYKRKGSNQAFQAFQEVIDNFPDQPDVVKFAEEELASLSKPDTSTSKISAETKPQKVWQGKSAYGTGDVSPDGRFFTFINERTGGLELYDSVSRQGRPLNEPEWAKGSSEYVESAVISPDGKKIAYGWKNMKEGSELKVIGLYGSTPITLFKSNEVMSIRPVDWTADSKHILVCLTKSDFTNRVVLVSSSDGTLKIVKDFGLGWPDHMKISPDNRYIAYGLLQYWAYPERHIYLYDMINKREIPLVVQKGDHLLLGWTPEGKNILYTDNQSGTSDVWLLAIREGLTQRIPQPVKRNMEQFEPMGFTENGSFYFETRAETYGETGEDSRITEVWALPNFLPEASKILTVPDDYPTIQSAVNAARPNDSIFVRKGLYSEHVIIGKPLTLQGEDRNTVIIDGGGDGSVVHIASSYVALSGFTVRNGKYGIEIKSSRPIHHTSVKDTIVTLNQDGIYSIDSGGDHLIESCTISNNKVAGLSAHQFSRSIIRNCEVFRNDIGLSPAWGWYVTVEKNRVYENRSVGIRIDSCYFSAVKNNLVCSNRAQGISFSYISSQNVVTDNIVVDNGQGFYLGLHWDGFGENRIYHNDICANRVQISGNQNSFEFQYWDNGYPSGGNYWSDYDGEDADQDGISDRSHNLTKGTTDNYPLVNPRNQIHASVTIDPRWVEEGENDKWIFVSLELPANISAEAIEFSTLLLNDLVSPEQESGRVADYDNDGITELMVKFHRREVAQILKASVEQAELELTGTLKNGIPFEGRGYLKLTHK